MMARGNQHAIHRTSSVGPCNRRFLHDVRLDREPDAPEREHCRFLLGPGFALLAAALPLLAGGPTWRSLLVLSMVAVWAGRLATHITVRNWGKREDWRYRKWRDEAPGSFWWRSYFRVFLLQDVLLVVVAAPILLTAWTREPVGLTVLDVVGVAVWGFGLLFEAVADGQLARFKRDPQSDGKVMDRGLWRYSRHPNYFGESVFWWGIFLVAASVSEGYAAIVGPIAITFLLLRVSGAGMLERGLRTTRPGYEDSVRRTSAFFPVPPKRR
jgi:steroid 5-alpha reductase family enzyme